MGNLIAGLLKTGSEEMNFFKRYENNHEELGPHECRGFLSIIVLMLLVFISIIYDLVINGVNTRYLKPIPVLANSHSNDCNKVEHFAKQCLQFDATVVNVLGGHDRFYAPPSENIDITMVSKPGCEVFSEDMIKKMKSEAFEKCGKEMGNMTEFATNKPLKITPNFVLPTWGSKERTHTGCSNECQSSNNGICEDGGKEDVRHAQICAYGTDCADCGKRTPTCGLVIDDDLDILDDMTPADFRKALESRVLRKDTCHWHTLRACLDSERLNSATLISDLKRNYEDPTQWPGAVFHIETNTTRALMVKLCPTIPSAQLDETRFLRRNHGSAFVSESSAEAAGRCAEIVLGPGELHAVTFSKRGDIQSTIPGTQTVERLVVMDSQSYLGPINGFYRERLIAVNSRRPHGHIITHPQSRTLLILRGDEDVDNVLKNRIFDELGGLGGIFTVIVGIVGIFVNLCANVRPLPGYPVEKRGSSSSSDNDGSQQHKIEMRKNPMKIENSE
jgi:hypothetical protein